MPNYGNWVPKKVLYILGALFIFAGMVAGYGFFSENQIVLAVGIVLVLFIGYVCLVFINARYQCSYSGGGVSGKILDYVLQKLEWNGQGKLLDIGCGSGALSIKSAKKFPQAQIVGIDYWGAMWDYNKSQCEGNAKIEGIANVSFAHGDASRLNFPDETFDAVVSNFVFHEVKSVSDKKLLIAEALRVLKPGAAFSFHDLFFQERYYGKLEELKVFLDCLNLSEYHLEETENLPCIPRSLHQPFLLKKIGILYGKK